MPNAKAQGSKDAGRNWMHVADPFPANTRYNIDTYHVAFDAAGAAWAVVDDRLYVGRDRASRWELAWTAPEDIDMLACRRIDDGGMMHRNRSDEKLMRLMCNTWRAICMKTRWKLVIMIVTILILIASVFMFARVMSPIQEGNSSIFWAKACSVSIRGGRGTPVSGFSGGIYPAREGWFIYYSQDYHGQRLYRVSHSEVAADFPRAIQLIEEAAGRENARKIILDAYVVIEENRAEIEDDPAKFISLLRDYRMAELLESDPDWYHYRIDAEQEFDQRWERAKRFWVNIAFECALFAGLALFAFWPWLWGKSKWRICLHLGLLPLLLFIPHYLGYAGWTFTSAGPSGGVIYPLVIFNFHPLIVSWTSVDIWIIESLPHMLEPISQSLGPMLSISGGGTLPPVSALLLGIAIFWAAWFGPGLFRRARSALNRLPGGGRRL